METQSTNTNLLKSIWPPLLLASIMWAVFMYEQLNGVSFTTYGILPRNFIGIRGVLLAPFIHGDWEHLINNTYPVIILGGALFYIYRKSAWTVTIYSFLFTGLWVWAMGRNSFHIGMSGVIYAWGAFLFTSGVLTKSKPAMGISFMVVFLYGSMVWGVLPIIPHISWESHLFGAIIGVVLAFVFQSDSPQRKKYEWEEKEEEYEIEFWNMTQTEINEYYQNKEQEKTSRKVPKVFINYVFKKKEED